MAGAGTGRERLKGSVFQKLEGQAGIKAGENNLQYPTELGNDEYNHFVLFTVYEKDSQEVQDSKRNATIAEQDILLSRQEDGAEFSGWAEQLGDIAGLAAEEYGISDFLSGINIPFSLIPLSTFVPQVSGGARRTAELSEYYKRILAETKKQSIAEQFINEQSKDAVKYAKEQGLDISERTKQSAILGRLRYSPATYKQSTNIALYIPQKLVNNGSISYDNVSFEVAQGLSAVGLGDFGSLGPVATRKAARLIDSALSIVGVNANANEAIQAVTGLAINPRAEQIFNGVAARSFDMSFRLVPRNQTEAVEVSNIIRAFRKYSHPSVRSGNFFLSVPAEFDIRYYRVDGNGTALENLFLNKIGRCALTAINVDYSPSSISSFFYDGSPVMTTITMTFNEFRPLTREDIEEGY